MILIPRGEKTSEVFSIKTQVTFFASGLGCNEEVVFELVTVSRSKPPNGDLCCPGPVVLPDISTRSLLTMCCGCETNKAVRLTSTKPWAVIDMPQQVPLRAIVGCNGAPNVEVEYFETTSRGVSCVGDEPSAPCSN